MLKDVLEDFAKYVVQQSRSNLTKKDKNVSKQLYNSINYDTKVSKNSFELTINMADHGKFIDKGVKGSKEQSKAPTSPYKYTNKMPPAKVFDKWSVKRGLAKRDKKGRFLSRKAMNFVIARSVFLSGIETTNFLTTPFERAFKRLPDDVVEAYGLELENLFKTTMI